ncbi:hypothetical protein ACLRGF_08335 [Mycetocola zhadangensis]|uniref:hypothetical protein n=1 Tax=Mycetocola zhadangensis TaxID=1164595 RepID=UPI003A4D67AF
MTGLRSHPISDYLPRMRAGQFFSGVTAALIHGMYLPWRLTKSALPLHITAIAPARAPRTRGVVGHHALAGQLDVGVWGDIPVVSPVDTWCQLAEVLTIEELVVMGDGLVCRQKPVATLAQLSAAVARFAGRPGSAKLRAALSLVRPRTDSPQESRLRLVVRAAGLPEPVVNHPIYDQYGHFIGFGDLAYPREKVLLEYDGDHHFESAEQARKDVDRLENFMAERWRIIRVKKEHLALGVRSARIRALRNALVERGWRPSA